MGNFSSIARLRGSFFAAAHVALVLGLLLATVGSAGAAVPAARSASVEGPAQAGSAHLLIENVGQFAGEARFLLRQGDHRIWLTNDAVWLIVPDAVRGNEQRRLESAGPLASLVRQRHERAGARPGTAVRFVFEGANSAPTLEPFGALPTHVSYLIGNDPAAWQTDVPAWSGVRYRDLYPGIDLVIGEGASGTVPWRLEARAGADLTSVRLRAEGANVVAAEAGRLRLSIKDRTLDVALPSWSIEGQGEAGGSAAVPQADSSAFALAPDAQAADVAPEAVTGAEDLIYFKTLTGAAADVAYGVAVDANGNTYITGETESTNLPVTPGAYDPNSGAAELADAFVAKYPANGSSLPIYLTYLGGSDSDVGWGIAVSSANEAFVAGETMSTNFPGMSGAVSGTDVFVAALNATGTGVRYVSRLGSSGYDAAYGIALGGVEAYIVGTTTSTSICAGSANGDLLVAKLNSTGGQVYANCLNWADPDAGYAIRVRNGEAYVAGDTVSTTTGTRDITTGWFQIAGNQGGGTVFDTWAGDEWVKGLAVDATGKYYIAGTTTASSGFPGTSTTAPYGGGASDAFVMKLARAGTTLTVDFSTYLGGEGADEGYGIAVDAADALYVAGATTSTSFPMTSGAYATAPFGGKDAFVLRMHLSSAALDRVTYATYLGAGHTDAANAVAADMDGYAYVAGSTQTTADLESTNAYVAKVDVSVRPDAPAATIRVSGTGVLLSWGAVSGASKYRVYRSNQPYFHVSEAGSTMLVEQTQTSYTDPNVLNTVSAHFYTIKAVNSSGLMSFNSNGVGKFTFELTKGTQ